MPNPFKSRRELPNFKDMRGEWESRANEEGGTKMPATQPKWRVDVGAWTVRGKTYKPTRKLRNGTQEGSPPPAVKPAVHAGALSSASLLNSTADVMIGDAEEGAERKEVESFPVVLSAGLEVDAHAEPIDPAVAAAAEPASAPGVASAQTAAPEEGGAGSRRGSKIEIEWPPPPPGGEGGDSNPCAALSRGLGSWGAAAAAALADVQRSAARCLSSSTQPEPDGGPGGGKDGGKKKWAPVVTTQPPVAGEVVRPAEQGAPSPDASAEAPRASTTPAAQASAASPPKPAAPAWQTPQLKKTPTTAAAAPKTPTPSQPQPAAQQQKAGEADAKPAAPAWQTPQLKKTPTTAAAAPKPAAPEAQPQPAAARPSLKTPLPVQSTPQDKPETPKFLQATPLQNQWAGRVVETPKSPPLKPGWSAVQAEDGRTYYWNEETDEVSWEVPAAEGGSSALERARSSKAKTPLKPEMTRAATKANIVSGLHDGELLQNLAAEAQVTKAGAGSKHKVETE